MSNIILNKIAQEYAKAKRIKLLKTLACGEFTRHGEDLEIEKTIFFAWLDGYNACHEDDKNARLSKKCL
jgi:hypothetical protein